MRIILGLCALTLLVGCSATSESQVKDYNEFSNLPASEDVTPGNTPVPGDGAFFAYWKARHSAKHRSLAHAGNTMKYLLLNTNSSQWPYDSWNPNQLSRSVTNMHNTLDVYMFNFDWDDPFGN